MPTITFVPFRKRRMQYFVRPYSIANSSTLFNPSSALIAASTGGRSPFDWIGVPANREPKRQLSTDLIQSYDNPGTIAGRANLARARRMASASARAAAAVSCPPGCTPKTCPQSCISESSVISSGAGGFGSSSSGTFPAPTTRPLPTTTTTKPSSSAPAAPVAAAPPPPSSSPFHIPSSISIDSIKNWISANPTATIAIGALVAVLMFIGIRFR